MICSGLDPTPLKHVLREYIYPSLSKRKFGDSYAVYALLALSKATTESLNSHPDKLLRIVVNTNMPKICALLWTRLLGKFFSAHRDRA